MNDHKYFEIREGKCPIILSCPHGGYKKPKFIPDKTRGTMIADRNKYLIAKQIIRVLKEEYYTEIFYILSKIHRCKVDFNRPPRSHSAFNHDSDRAKKIHQYYHDQIDRLYKECIDQHGRCLFIDLHGFTKPQEEYPDIILGNLFGKTLKITNNTKNVKELNCQQFWGCSELTTELSKYFSFDNGLGISDYNLGYSGGYITHKFYHKEKVNAIQVEVARYIREEVSFTKRFIEAFVKALVRSLVN
ncbi:MAG: hypothetical protein GF383_14615 [Candidatus Lokiarchaeota archaeon]|nr:hypothetical protein [Candidatus Lokiarchaeota archaeon]MBD3342650.1 hypothetical protein [Candidatus Lokiarchaeota archaeon]